MNHPQVVQSPIINDSVKVNIYGHTRPQIVPKLLLRLSVRELRNILVIDPDNGGLNETISTKNIPLSLIINYVHYCHPNFKISAWYNVMCGCECCISTKSIYSSLL